MPTLSIIVVVRDQLPMNRLFLEHLRAATDGPYELIVVDNLSAGGGAETARRRARRC